MDDCESHGMGGMVGITLEGHRYIGETKFVEPNPSFILFLYNPTQKLVEWVERTIDIK